ncbi:thioredoxin-like protein [Syncephalis fuscata]|nr:thioredoxin-like protein [Syncephalis fuscata]
MIYDSKSTESIIHDIKSAEEFKTIVQQNDDRRIFVIFYITWFGHNKRALSIAEYVAKECRDTLFIKVNAEKLEALVDAYHIDGYPTMMLLKSGTRINYPGPFSYDHIKRFINIH